MGLARYARVRQYYAESLQAADCMESPYDACFTLDSLGLVAHYQGDDASALIYFSRALAIAEAGPRVSRGIS